MEDLDDSISSTRFEALFIKEEEVDGDRTPMEQRECNSAQSGLTITQLNQCVLIKPYLQEMDDLLKSCEELTGIPFSSHFSDSYNETSLNESTHYHSKDEDAMKSHGGRSMSPQAYLFTSYIDTNMDGAETENQQAQGQSQGLATIINRCEVTRDVSHQRKMPLTSVGHKLSDTMVEYEGQLMGMLAMLESCMEEAGMDSEPQDWSTDASQEYVHISKNPHLCGGNTLVPIQQERPVKLETEPMQLESSWAGQHAWGERKSNLKTEDGVRDAQFRFSEPSMPLSGIENDPLYLESTKTGSIPIYEDTYTKEHVTGLESGDTELPAEEGQETKMDTTDLGSGMNDIAELGSQMEKCIEEVQQLERRRKELLAEVMELRGNKDREEAEGSNEEEMEEPTDIKVAELMNLLKQEEEGRREERKREIQSLREERAEEERRMWKVNLEKQGLQEELRKLKMRLFTMARDCAHNQIALNTQHREVEVLKREEEKLQSLVLQLTEEVSQLRTAQKQQLFDLQEQLHAHSSSQTSNTQDELAQCRRHSCGDIQQYLQGGLRALEDRYEPILLALLKRREVTAGALAKAKEQAQELRTQLRPLQEEIQKLKLQKACLEEKLKLMHIQRREDVGQYKEMVYCLEESSRELKTELKIQKRKTKEIEDLRDSLTKQLMLYRAAIEDHNKCEEEERT
uniref:trichohyalin n=1 Tax=Scatophagus argus TaxID=75038 RepID=UPI001ED83AFD|nr:trichohyalin [Scatophagus argus]